MGEDHAWRAWRTANKIDYWQRTLDWFDEHLGRGPERPEREVAVPTPTTGRSDDPPAIRIEAGTDGRLNGGNVVHIEPHLAVHPEHPDRMVVAVMTLPEPGGGFRIRVYRSTDGGASWKSSTLTSRGTDADAVGVDPWLAYGPDGALYFTKLPGEVWRSADDGRSWSGPVTLPTGTGGGYDAPRMKVDRTGGPYRGRVYVSMMQASVPRPGGESDNGVAVLQSGDGGRSFGGPVRLTMSDVGKRHGDLAVLPDGTLLVTFHDLFHDGRVLESPRLWSVRSEDGGETFTTPSLITERFLALWPLLAVDRDGPHRGRAYAAWLGLGGDRNRYIAHTDNGGDSWSDPTQVTALPDSIRHPTYTAVAVSSDGTVGLMWAENVVADGASCFEYRFAASVDGGETFSEPVVVSDSVSCSDTEAHRVVMHDDGPRQATVFERFPQGGDYFGLVALPEGAFQAVWPDARTGVFQLWTDRIRVVR